MNQKRSLRDIDVAGKRVLVRVDYNVPQDGAGAITDNSRIRETLPTLRYLLERNARVILVAHLGRPDGKVVAKLTLEPIAAELSRLLGQQVVFARDTVGPDALGKTAELQPGEVLLLENVRFHGEEEANDPAFAAQLANLADVYVNDAFGTAHRAHASTAGVAAYRPAVAGLLMERELQALGQVLETPQRPLTAVIGGAKVSSKIGVLENLLRKVDAMVVGGGMACTFLKAQGLEIGKSLVELDRLDTAREMLEDAKLRGVSFLLPADGICAASLNAAGPTSIEDASHMPADLMMLDIGPRTVELFISAINESKTILWNGPMGVFEVAPFASGTAAIAAAIGESGATTIVGGGDTVAAIEQYSDETLFSHVSTGGGASLEFLEGRTLPGVAALEDR